MDLNTGLKKRIIFCFYILIASSFLDQITKFIAKISLPFNDAISYLAGTLRFQLTHNNGAFLSLGASLPDEIRQFLLTVGITIFLICLLGYILLKKTITNFEIFSLSMILSGGMNNLFDRLYYHGYVVDFINIGIGSLRTGIFNIADVFIMIGSILLLFITYNNKDITLSCGNSITKKK